MARALARRSPGTTTTAQVYDSVLAAVLDGTYAPGAHIRLQDLADSMGTSMQPVREALRQLSAVGIVDIEPHRGARVRPLSDADFEDTYRTRLAIEGLLVQRAAALFTDEDAATAQTAVDRHQAALDRGDRAAARDAHQAFHFSIYEAARSPWLLRSALPTWHNAERYRLRSTVSAHDAAGRRSEHLELLTACRQHDADAARSALVRHLLATVAQHSPTLAALLG